MSIERFETVLQADEGTTGTYIEVPLDVRAVFGRARPPVRGTLNGYAFRSHVAPYGSGFYLPVNRALREGAGVAAGQTVVVELELDDELRTVETPADLAAALDAEPELRAAFERLSFTHRREYVEWIAEAKRDATRQKRIAGTLDRLRGNSQPST